MNLKMSQREKLMGGLVDVAKLKKMRKWMRVVQELERGSKD